MRALVGKQYWAWITRMDHLKLNSDRLLDEAYDRSVALLHEVSSPIKERPCR